MICQWCGKDFPTRKGRFCVTCYPPNHPSNRPSLHNVDLHKAIDATMMGIHYHPAMRGKIDEATGKDIHTMLTTLAETAFRIANAPRQGCEAYPERGCSPSGSGGAPC